MTEELKAGEVTGTMPMGTMPTAKEEQGMTMTKVWGMMLVSLAVGFVSGVSIYAMATNSQPKTESGVSVSKPLTVEERVAALEKSKGEHEAALNGAATRLHQLSQAHDGLVQAIIQDSGTTRGMIAMMEKVTASYIGDKKWQDLVSKAKAEIEKKKSEVKSEVKSEPKK